MTAEQKQRWVRLYDEARSTMQGLAQLATAMKAQHEPAADLHYIEEATRGAAHAGLALEARAKEWGHR